MKRFRRRTEAYTAVVLGPEPVGEAGATAIGLQYGLNLAGFNGSVRWGEAASLKFSGYAASPQALIGAGSYGANRTPTPVGLEGALPNTFTPPGLPGALQSMYPTVPS